MSPYLTIAEAADLLRISPRALSTKMCKGVFREGEHYFRRRGMRALFKRAALESWIEGEDLRAASPETRIRMAGGYYLGSGR